MKQVVILLPDDSRIEIDESKVKHIDKDGKVLYDSAKFSNVEKPLIDGWGYDDPDSDWN